MTGENRIVTMTRDMHPWRAGQDGVVPAALAEKLIKAGDAKDSRPFPPQDVAPAIPVASKAPLKPARGYFTRKRG